MDPLELVYDSESDIPEGFAALYKERGGKWHLTGIKGLKTEADTKKLQTALDAERKIRKDAESKAKRYEALGERDPADVLKALDEVDELRAKLEAGGGTTKEAQQKIIDAAVQRALGPVERELAAAKADNAKIKGEVEAEASKVGKLRGRIKQSALEQEISKAAAAAKVVGTAVPDVLLYASIFDVEEDEETGRITAIKTKDGVGVTPGLGVSDWLADMKSNRPHWWEGSVGGGAKGSNGGGAGGAENPFNPKAPNMTAASKLVMTDPAKALTLAKAAGFSSPEEAFAAAARADAKI